MHSPVVLGLDFGGTKIAAAVSEAGTGLRLGTTTAGTHADGGARRTLQRGVRAARSLLDGVAAGRTLVAVGVSTIGIPTDDGVRLAPAIPGWDELPLGPELRRAFAGAEIRLVTDVKAAARAEAESGALAGCDPGLYLNLGTGLAAAIVADGAVLSGRHGAAGEIGYNLRHRHDVGAPLTDRIPLEDAVSGKALLGRAAGLLPGASPAAVFAGAGAHPPTARLLADFVQELSYHLVNLAIAVDPARIAVGGGMARSWDQLEGGLRAALAAAVPFPPELVLARFPYDAPLRGALALGIAAARELLDRTATTPLRKGLSR